ncbi:type II/IV secretion system protein [bacterium]|nr:type II/IV secretion system protein [bacterium]
MVQITDKINIPKEIQELTEKKIESIPDFQEAIKKYLERDVTELLSLILAGAIKLSASDIHFEPRDENVRLRIRLDGMLQDVIILEEEVYHFLLSRIKLLAGLKLNIHDKAQDGSFSVVFSKVEIEIRTSALPADYGESIVMRILNPENLKSIEELGLRKDLLELFKKEIQKPNGMIIVTGPTGSGKTTTLYAFLKYLQRPEIKIITIEDPIEYRLKGISQTEVRPEKGYDFPNGLRAIVRQDPDVILVGEIRDLETAQIALQAALTGHLVFSTLHTNDAAGTVPRLISLGANPINIAPAINMAIAQRLVRRVCPKCAIPEKISEEDYKKIKEELSGLSPHIEIPEISPDLEILKPQGCKYCNFTGYKGRIGIFEAFLVDDEMEELILKKPAISEIRKLAIKKGMLTMYQDGLIKVLQKITTIEEVKRVAMEE